MSRNNYCEWRYEHFKGTYFEERIKRGEFIRLIKHRRSHWDCSRAKQMAAVLFEGNKKPSVVPYQDLFFWDWRLDEP